VAVTEHPTGQVVGVGVDVCSIERMRTALARTPRFAVRVFTEGERAYAEGFADPAGVYAARFAAKEAAMKAMGAGIEHLPFTAIELTRAGTGAPSLVLHGPAQRMATERAITRFHVSISHDAGVAVAFVVAVG
jgi:holo-[acyl-carrier protein] synthase